MQIVGQGLTSLTTLHYVEAEVHNPLQELPNSSLFHSKLSLPLQACCNALMHSPWSRSIVHGWGSQALGFSVQFLLDRDLESLSSLVQLRELSLCAAHSITGAGLAYLNGLSHLQVRV